MAGLIWTEPALQDLDAIADYISLDRPEAAKALVKKVFQKVSALRRFPKMGSIPRELTDLTYRQLVVPPCRVFYKVEGKHVYILYVMRSERLLRAETLTEREP